MKNLPFYRVVRMVERQVLVENPCVPKMLQLVMEKRFIAQNTGNLNFFGAVVETVERHFFL